jgi:hypothetical protein
VEKEGAEGKDCQPVQSTAMDGMQTWDQMGSAGFDTLEEVGEAVVEGMTGTESMSTLGLQSLEGD